MGIIKRKYSNKEVNRAGNILKENNPDHPEINWAEDVLTNWRSLHSYPINTFQATLREKLKVIDNNAIVAQRLKRTPSIIAKLRRFDSMQLSRMQDVAGLRAVVKNIKIVRELEDNYKKSHFDHELKDEKDYIINPKSTGYRGIHLVYRYRNHNVPGVDGLMLELQLRTKLQHAWATAVETTGTFLDHALKSSEGPEEWLEFFSIAGSAFAYLEKCKPLEKYSKLSEKANYKLLIQKFKLMDVEKKLNGYTVAAQSITQDTSLGKYHLIILNLATRRLKILNFGRQRFDEANDKYTEIEKSIVAGEPLQVVLVSTSSIKTLRQAYPNYFLDTQGFLQLISFIEKKIKF